MIVSDILKTKGPEVFSIGEDKPMIEAMKILVNNNIGSVLCLNSDGKLTGILTERDVLRGAYQYPETFKDIHVKKLMTEKIIMVEPDDKIEYVENVMSVRKIRHLPVLKDKLLVGIISIGDIVNAIKDEKNAECKYLMDYISGGY